MFKALVIYFFQNIVSHVWEILNTLRYLKCFLKSPYLLAQDNFSACSYYPCPIKHTSSQQTRTLWVIILIMTRSLEMLQLNVSTTLKFTVLHNLHNVYFQRIHNTPFTAFFGGGEAKDENIQLPRDHTVSPDQDFRSWGLTHLLKENEAA